ncbi:hypothetical protein [Streptomyces sp. NPDC091217]|uniref:hypothetical protein n=1 Tax=Streptomyces sp. NPDC091217 TaxID=3365975 RepID=UPI0037F7614E
MNDLVEAVDDKQPGKTIARYGFVHFKQQRLSPTVWVAWAVGGAVHVHEKWRRIPSLNPLGEAVQVVARWRHGREAARGRADGLIGP